MATVYDVANFFVDIQRDQPDSDMTLEKLQMLVYYAQGFSLAILGHPLFSEELFACECGPACPELCQSTQEVAE